MSTWQGALVRVEDASRFVDAVRELEYYLDGGGWIAQGGTPQLWEADYFFSEHEGTGEGEQWPSNLNDDLSQEEIVRYEQARTEKAPSSVMDLLMVGDVERLCKFYSVDPRKPQSRYGAGRNWCPRILFALVVALLVGAFILGVAMES